MIVQSANSRTDSYSYSYKLTHYHPPYRTGTIEEVAAITKFIVSKEASFNTAFCFDLSGGRATY